MSFRRRTPLWGVVAACWLDVAAVSSQECLPPLKASDAAAGDLYGCAVSFSDGLLLVGSLGDDDGGSDAGKAYLYERTRSGWTERDQPTAPDPAAGDQFGYSVALHQGWAVVGAPFKQTRGSASGAAYVLRCGAAGCAEPEKLRSTARLSPFDQFGFSVAVHGSTVAVGAPGAAAVDLFARRAGSWQWLQRIVPGPGREAESFGFSVALSDGVLAVGAPDADAVFVFQETDGAWTLAGEPLRGSAGDRFGHSVALGEGTNGWTAVVGAPGTAGGGAVHVFTGLDDGGPLAVRSRLSSDARLGVSVAVDPEGRTVLAGARTDDERGPDAGAAFVFARRADGSFVETAKLTDARQRAGDELGLGATIADGVAVVGAFKDDAGAVDSGAAYSSVLDSRDLPTCGPVLELTKDGPSTIDRKSVEYQVSVSNRGDAEARGIVLQDDAPDFLELERVIFPGCEESGLPCRLGNLDLSDDPLQATLVFAVSPTACDQAEIENTATAGGEGIAAVEARSPPAVPDCSAELTAGIGGPQTALAGSQVTYDLWVSRSGTLAATLELTAPGELELSAVSAPCRDGFPCDLGQVPAGDVHLTAAFTVSPSACTGPPPHEVTVRAAVSSSRLESDLADNTDAWTTQVLCSDLAVDKEGPSSVVAGESAAYTITVVNLGPGIARDLRLEDSASPGLELESVSEPCSGFPCDLGDVAAGAAVPVEVSYRVAADACCSGIDEVTNEALVTNADLDGDNNRDGVTSAVECKTDLAVPYVVVDPPATCSGQPLSYTFAVTNAGSSDVCGARLDARVESAGFSGPSCECDGATVEECTSAGDLGSRVDLPAGETIRCRFDATLTTASAPFEITAESEVPARYMDDDPANDAAGASFTADLVDLALTKAVTPAAVYAGDDVTYRFTLVNPGPCTATGVSLDDPFLADSAGILTCTGPCSDGWPCPLSDLPPGERPLELSCEVDPELRIGGAFATRPVVNEARASAANPDPEPINNGSSATFLAQHDADLRLSVTDGLASTSPGETTLYTVRLENGGPSSLVDGRVRLAVSTGDEILDEPAVGLAPSAAREWSVDFDVMGPPGEIVATATVSDPDGFTLAAKDSTFVVPPGIFLGATMAGTFSVSGRFIVGGSVTYRVVLLNRGPLPQADNAFAELRVIFDEELRFLSGTPSGTVTSPAAGVVEWNGDLAAEDQVEIKLRAQIVDAEPDDEICARGKIFFDSDGDRVNDRVRALIPGPDQMSVDETCFVVVGEHDIPTAGPLAWIVLAALLAALGLARLRAGLSGEGRRPVRARRAARE